MGYNYELEKSAGSEILLIPDDPIEKDFYPIEASDIAKMIELYFGEQFTEDDLIEALGKVDKYKSLRAAFDRAIDEIRNWNGGDELADEIIASVEDKG